MKKLASAFLLFVSLLAGYHAEAQDEGDIPANGRTFGQIFDSFSTGLIKERIPYGVLMDRVVDWSGLRTWASYDTTYEYRLYQAWWDLENAIADEEGRTDTYAAMRQSVDERLNLRELPILAIHKHYAYIDTGAFSDSRLTVVEGVLTDNNLEEAPYLTGTITMAGIPVKEVDSGQDYLLTFKEIHVSNNTDENIASIRVTNLTTDETFTLFPEKEEVVQFQSVGENTLQFDVEFAEDVHSYSLETIKVKGGIFKTTGVGCGPTNDIIASSMFLQGYEENQPSNSYGDYHVYYHNLSPTSPDCERKLIKPIIILDGFDAQDKRPYNEIYDEKLLIVGTTQKYGDILRQQGYDVIILNFPKLGSTIEGQLVPQYAKGPTNSDVLSTAGRDGGTDYMERNAYVLISLIQKVNAELATNGSTEKLVIVGPSMGGQISRYALAYMEEKEADGYPDMDHRCRLWVSFDSPHEGANIPIGLHDALNFFGTSNGSQFAADAYNKQIRSVAARQLLLEQRDGQNGLAPFRQYWSTSQSSIGLTNSNGWPQKTRRIALLNGSGTGQKTHWDGATVLEGTGDVNGLNSNIKVFELKQRFLASPGNSNEVFYGRVSSQGSLIIPWIWPTWIWPIPYPIPFSLSVTRPNANSRGSMDAVPGSTIDAIADDLFHGISQTLTDSNIDQSWTTILNNHCFIPSVSAMGFKYPRSNWNTAVSPYAQLCGSSTYFDDIYAPSNNEPHITLTPANVAWLEKAIVDYKIQNAGPVGRCETRTLTISPAPPTGWSVSVIASYPSLQVVSVSGNTIVVKGVSANSAALVNVAISEPGTCVSRTISATIPVTDYNYNIIFTIGFPSCLYSAHVTPIKPGDSYYWSFDGSSYTSSSSTSFGSYMAQYGANIPVYLKVVTACGDIRYYQNNFTVQSPNPPPGVACPYRIGRETGTEPKSSDRIEIAPNPTNADWSVLIYNNTATSVRVRLTDVAGREAWSKLYTDGAHNNGVTVPGDNLQPGVYFLQVKMDGKERQFKLVKQ